MAHRHQSISLPPQVSFERGRPYPARRASDSETPSMTRTSPAWAVARNHSASPPLTAISEHHASHNHTHKNPELEYHRRLKAASKRDRHKLAKEDEYALDRTLAQVAPEQACARCKSQRWRCYIPRDPHSPRRTCLPCGKNKCTFGGSKTRPPTIDGGAAASVTATNHNANNIEAVPNPSTRASTVDAPSAPSPAPSLLSLDTVPPPQRPRPTLPLSLPSRNWADFYRATPLLPSLSLPTPQLSPGMTTDRGFGNPNRLPTSPRDRFFLPPVRTSDRELKREHNGRRDHHNRDRELPTPRLSVPAPDTSRRMSVPQLLTSPSSSPTSSAPATPAASIVTTPPADVCPRSYTPGAPAPFDVLPPMHCNGGAPPTAPPAWDLPPATDDLLGLLLECAERYPADPRARRVAEGMMGAARVQWVSAIGAAQARGEARTQRRRVRECEREHEERRGRCKAELENVHPQMARGLTQAREAMCRAIEID